MIALRMRRQCISRHTGINEYDKLYRDLSPGLNLHRHGFGQPPCLVCRTDFDGAEYNGRRQLERTLVKGRFQNGNIGFIEAEQMELYACMYQKPYRPTEYTELLLRLIERKGHEHSADEGDDRSSGKGNHPALHRLQEAFLLFEDQNDGKLTAWQETAGRYGFSPHLPAV